MNKYESLVEIARIQANQASDGLLVGFLGVVLMILAFILLIEVITTIRNSKKYRQFLADMFVASKIKQYALKEGLDITQEAEDFKKWDKKQRIEYMSLDNSVEAELQEKIAEDVSKLDKKLDKK